jgi:acyl carrier protein
MLREAVIEQVNRYIAQDVLEGKDIGLDETTPLLEWGIINSLEMVKLLSFMRRQFGVDIPIDQLVADSFSSTSSIADLILERIPEDAIHCMSH